MCERWGAPAKAQRIRTMYAAVLAAAGRYEFSSGPRDAASSKDSTTQSMFSADLETVVQASQAIISEVSLPLPPPSTFFPALIALIRRMYLA